MSKQSKKKEESKTKAEPKPEKIKVEKVTLEQIMEQIRESRRLIEVFRKREHVPVLRIRDGPMEYEFPFSLEMMESTEKTAKAISNLRTFIMLVREETKTLYPNGGTQVEVIHAEPKSDQATPPSEPEPEPIDYVKLAKENQKLTGSWDVVPEKALEYVARLLVEDYDKVDEKRKELGYDIIQDIPAACIIYNQSWKERHEDRDVVIEPMDGIDTKKAPEFPETSVYYTTQYKDSFTLYTDENTITDHLKWLKSVDMKIRHRQKDNYPKLGSSGKYIMLNIYELQIVAAAVKAQGKKLIQGEKRSA